MLVCRQMHTLIYTRSRMRSPCDFFKCDSLSSDRFSYFPFSFFKFLTGTRPTPVELLEARQFLFRIIERLVVLHADEFTKLLFYLQECNDPPQLIGM